MLKKCDSGNGVVNLGVEMENLAVWGNGLVRKGFDKRLDSCL